MELKYKSNKNNNDYIILMDDIIGLRVQALDRNIPDDIQEEIIDMHYEINMLSKSPTFHKIAIRRDSKFGNWIIQNTDGKTIINDDTYISFNKVCSALLSALDEDEEKVSNKIWYLFKERISGTKEELVSKYDEYVLDYILQHSTFSVYSEEIGEKEINNANNYINFTKIKNAYLVALNEENDKITNKIRPLFKERISGTKEEISLSKHDEYVLDYILQHPNFDEYKDDQEREDEEYMIYEDGHCRLSSISKVPNEKVKFKGAKREC